LKERMYDDFEKLVCNKNLVSFHTLTSSGRRGLKNTHHVSGEGRRELRQRDEEKEEAGEEWRSGEGDTSNKK